MEKELNYLSGKIEKVEHDIDLCLFGIPLNLSTPEELYELQNEKRMLENTLKSIKMEVIVQALKNIEYDLRLINHKRWMVWNDTNKEWEVYESKNGRLGKLIIATRDESEAVHSLLSE